MAWFDTDKRRLTAELLAGAQYNRARRPGFSVRWSRSSDALVLRAAIRPTVNLYRLCIFLGDGYPTTPPAVVIEEPEIPLTTPHLIGAQRPCLFKGTGTQPWNWNPDLHTGVFALLAAWRWALAHDLYVTTGEWAVRDAREAELDDYDEDSWP